MKGHTEINFSKVTDLERLDDANLVPELQKRVKDGRLPFIAEDCQKQIEALRLTEDEKQLDHKSASRLWQPLIENAVTYLKMSDPREWAEEYGEPSSVEEVSSLKAFGIEKLNDYFVQFREFEKMLYGAEKYYHEHTLHVFRVWVLGTLLLDDWSQDRRYPRIEFFEYVSDRTGKKVSELIKPQEIQAMWCIISLSHDLGYPLQKVDIINEQTRTMLRQYAKVNLQDLNFDVPQQHQFINDFILKFISSQTIFEDEYRQQSKSKQRKFPDKERVFRTHVQAKYYLKYSKSLEDFEHGIFSSIILMKNLTYFLESDFDMDELKPLDYKDAKQSAIRKEILRAIAGHTCEQIYHIRPDTLSFLLILCDELQSWGRPTIEEILRDSDSKSPRSRLIKYRGQEVEFEIDFYDSDKDFYDRTKDLFQRFHTLLRAAVDAPQREFSCQLKVKSISSPGWLCVFNFISKKEKAPEFKFTVNNVAWNPWDEEYTNIVEKLKNTSKIS